MRGLLLLLLLLGGCKASSFYAPAGATAGATIGALGGPAMSGGGALLGFGIGKGAQIIDENKELKENLEALSTGDVETIAKNALKKGMEAQEGKFSDFISKIEKWLIIAAICLALYLTIPIFVAHKTATKCSKTEARKAVTRVPFNIPNQNIPKPSDNEKL